MADTALIVLAIQLLALLTQVLLLIHANRKGKSVLQETKRAIANATEGAADLLLQLKTERARAAGTIATAQRRGTLPPPPSDPPPSEPEEEGASPLDIPPALLGVAQGAGLDVEKLKAGDPTEIAKGLELWNQRQGTGDSSNGRRRARNAFGRRR